MNVKKILVPVDYSNNGDAAMAYAVSLARESDGELHLVHVHEPIYSNIDTGFSDYPLQADIPPVDIEQEEAKLRLLSPADDVNCHHKFIVGNPVDVLVSYAKENQVDLIVMGTHGRTGLTRLLMGSVAEGVLRRSPCPVLTIKQPAEELQESA